MRIYTGFLHCAASDYPHAWLLIYHSWMEVRTPLYSCLTADFLILFTTSALAGFVVLVVLLPFPAILSWWLQDAAKEVSKKGDDRVEAVTESVLPFCFFVWHYSDDDEHFPPWQRWLLSEWLRCSAGRIKCLSALMRNARSSYYGCGGTRFIVSSPSSFSMRPSSPSSCYSLGFLTSMTVLSSQL